MHSFVNQTAASKATARPGPTPTLQSNLPGNHSAALQQGLNSPGQPLESSTRSLMEQHFSHNFSDVRVHTDAQAARSARALEANAYTFGHDIVFDTGRYAPASRHGQQLLAHELAHVMQQRHATDSGNTAPAIDHAGEVEADLAAASLGQNHGWHSGMRHQSRQRMIARQAQCEELPGFSQNHPESCGAASLVTAIMIWDRERRNPAAPNTLLIAACNNALLYIINKLTAIDAARRKEAASGVRSKRDFEAEINKLRIIHDALTQLRDQVQQSQQKVDQQVCEQLGQALYALQKEEDISGLRLESIRSLQGKLGIDVISKVDASQRLSFDELVGKLTGLRPGQIAQVSWFSRGPFNAQGQAGFTPHAFLIGRFQRGPWFVSDQGGNPPLQLEAASLEELVRGIRNHTAQRNKGIHTGGFPVASNAGRLGASETAEVGVTILGNQGGIERSAQASLLKPGEFLAEVDASLVRSGDRIVVREFADYAHSLPEAKQKLDQTGSDGGGVLIEKPAGLFHIYKTSLVSDHNVNETAIDEADSADGAISRGHQRFFQAWLKLRSRSGAGKLFQVY